MTRVQRIIVVLMLPVCILLAPLSAGLFWFAWEGFHGRLEAIDPAEQAQWSLFFCLAGVMLALPLLLCASMLLLDWRRPRPKTPGTCKDCGYDLTANTTGVCPECGKSADGVH